LRHATRHDGIDAPTAQHVCRKGACEQIGDRLVLDIQTTGIGAKCRQHHALSIRREAASAQTATMAGHGGAGMQVAGNLAPLRDRCGLVTKNQTTDGQFKRHATAKPARRLWIVIAFDPNPVGATDERGELRPLGVIQTVGSLRVVEGIPQRNDARRRVACHHRSDTLQRGARVVGRQQRTAPCQRRAFFEVDVGEDERALGWPPRGSGAIEQQALAVDVGNYLVSRHAWLP